MRLRLTLLTLVSSFAGAQASAAETLVALPAMTPVLLQFDEEISSNRHRNGDRFRLRVAADVCVGDTVLIPAGSTGEGEVIHAQKSGMGGRAGELIVTARFVSVAGRQVRLRSFSPGAGTGKQHIGASYATSVLVGPAGLLVQGGALIMPRDMLANATTAHTTKLPAVRATSGIIEGTGHESTTD